MPLERIVRTARDTAARLLTRGRAGSAGAESIGLGPESMVLAYANGLFPLGRPNGRVDWQSLEERAVVACDAVHVGKRLKTYLRKDPFDICYNERFDEVLSGCADREETWINRPLADAYRRLHSQGIAHSVEAHRDGELVGGGFGLAIGRVFFLESMFCSADHASKIAFVRLAERLAESGFEWIDCQYLSEHWKRFGAQPVARDELTKRVVAGLAVGRRFESSQLAKEASDAACPVAPLSLEGVPVASVVV